MIPLANSAHRLLRRHDCSSLGPGDATQDTLHAADHITSVGIAARIVANTLLEAAARRVLRGLQRSAATRAAPERTWSRLQEAWGFQGKPGDTVAGREYGDHTKDASRAGLRRELGEDQD